MDIQIDGSWLIDKVRVKTAHVRQMGIVELNTTAEAVMQTLPKNKPFQGALRTARMAAQTTVTMEDGKTRKLDQLHVLTMPIFAARLIYPVLEDPTIKQGTIEGDGDGALNPVVLKLGTPIKGGGDKEIEELEFLAKTYGDIENVMGESGKLAQSVALLKYVAKPVGMQQLPTWAVEQITIPDGLLVMNKVIDRFLPQGETSDDE